MLVLSRRVGEEIVIDGQIRLVVAAVQRDQVSLAIHAPATTRVDRQEVYERSSLMVDKPTGKGVTPKQAGLATAKPKMIHE